MSTAVQRLLPQATLHLYVVLYVGTMPRQTGKLTALAVNKAKEKGLYGDGGGLWLQVTDTGSKSWLFRYMIDGKAQKMGLGALNKVSLADARDAAANYRKMLGAGVDPLTARKADQE